MSDLLDQLIDAAMDQIAEQGWANTSYTQVLQAAGLVYRDVYHVARDMEALMALFADRIDAAMLADAEAFDAETPVREHLFDLLMARFDALSDYKPALARIFSEQQRAPIDGLRTALRLERSMALALEAAGESSTGLTGQLRAKAMTALYLRCFRAWVKDDSEDLGPTMKVVDESLKQAERAASWLDKGPQGMRWPKWPRHPQTEASDGQAPDTGAGTAHNDPSNKASS